MSLGTRAAEYSMFVTVGKVVALVKGVRFRQFETGPYFISTVITINSYFACNL